MLKVLWLGKMETEDERIAAEIMKTVIKLELPLSLDEITERRGNCFPLWILAQCRNEKAKNTVKAQL